MSLLGKILAFLNILGVAGFLCLAAMVLGRQHAWEYANFRHDLIVYGLPLNDKEANKQGDPLVDNLGEATLQQLFPQGNPVTTQVAEVARVRQVLQGTLQQVEADKKKQLFLYSRYLLPLADTNAEREMLLAVRGNLVNDEKAEALNRVLKQAIRQALVIRTPDPKKRSFEEAYLEAVHARPGEPKDPFAEALLRVLSRPHEGGKSFDEAPLMTEEAFLQAVLNQPGKPFADLFTMVYDEAIESLRAELQQRYEDHFIAAAEGKRRVKDPASKNTVSRELLSPNQHKRAVAHLLFNLVEVMPVQGEPAQQSASFLDHPGYKRVITVVGVQQVSKEMAGQALVLRGIANDLNVAISREQTAFVLAHQELLEHLKDRAGQVDVQNAFLTRRKDMADEKEKVVVRRKGDVDYWTNELKEARQESNARFKELQTMSTELFKIRVQVRDATRLNQEYERQINSLEDRVR